MQIENLGTKTYVMTFDPAAVEPNEDGSGQMSFMSESTETRLHIPANVMGQLPAETRMVTVTGEARLKIWVNSDCGLSGIEEMQVSEIASSGVSQREVGFSEVIPF